METGGNAIPSTVKQCPLTGMSYSKTPTPTEPWTSDKGLEQRLLCLDTDLLSLCQKILLMMYILFFNIIFEMLFMPDLCNIFDWYI